MKKEGIQKPRQVRSLRTMNKILDAAASLLEEKLFEEISISEIASRAGCSVGAFYGRFKDKESLLISLDEKHFESFNRGTEALLKELKKGREDLPGIIRKTVAYIADVYGNSPGLLRALVLYAKQNRDEGFLCREKRAWSFYPDLHRIIIEHRGQMECPNPDLAVRFGFIQTFFTASEILLWGTRNEDFLISRETLVRELTRAYLGYLGYKFQHTKSNRKEKE